MAFDDIVRTAVALADTLTAPLQATVTYQQRTGQDHAGNPTYAASQSVQAVVEQKLETRTLPDGRTVSTSASITIPRPMTVGDGDKFTLPDATTAPIVGVLGVTDPDTNALYAVEVLLGVDRTVR